MINLSIEIADRTAQQTTVLDRTCDLLLDSLLNAPATNSLPPTFADCDWDGLD